MKATVVFEDGVILVDENPKFNLQFSQDPNWRVIQWQDDHGWIEVHQGDRLWLDTIDIVQPYIDMWINA